MQYNANRLLRLSHLNEYQIISWDLFAALCDVAHLQRGCTIILSAMLQRETGRETVYRVVVVVLWHLWPM